ncbi:MAG: sugar transferase, partial [Oscillospiraceae bacterium]|nr:sugar transferase [Oscillospiraceae bacterium]
SPLLLVAVIGVKLSSPGPLLFKQERVGLNKRVFSMLKFRSMRVNHKESRGWTNDCDPRRTRFGSFLRKFSIDELPQLINVLRGDMSLIGPRPEVPYFVEQFRESISLYMVKHQVRPGLTGWAQVNGYRGDTSIEERIRHDIWYIENWSVALDLKILLMTILGGWINDEKVFTSRKGK